MCGVLGGYIMYMARLDTQNTSGLISVYLNELIK